MNNNGSFAKSNAPQTALVTGGAGFIGSHLVDALLKLGHRVVTFDNFNSYYDPSVKRQNIAKHLANPNYTLVEGDLRDKAKVTEAFAYGPFNYVVHLAAMAGVRPSLEQPAYYMDVNINGTQILIDQILSHGKPRLVFGSSSSVYGKRSGEQFLETDRVDQPLSPYAASKAAGELLCYTAHHTNNLQAVCLRFFTVFGPRQRPDLAIHKFSRLIDQNKPIEVYGDGYSKRDYTYVGDIVSGIISSINYDLPGYDIINLGRSEPVQLLHLIKSLESAMSQKANLIYREPQMGDVPYTYANIDKARKVLNYNPSTSFEDGIKSFVHWHNEQRELALVGRHASGTFQAPSRANVSPR
jgi:UDP-glucuronate 4-epimerase